RLVYVQPHNLASRRGIAVIMGESSADDDFPIRLHRDRLYREVRSRAARVKARVARSVGVKAHNSVTCRGIGVVTGELAADDNLPIGLHCHRPHWAIRSRAAGIEGRVA